MKERKKLEKRKKEKKKERKKERKTQIKGERKEDTDFFFILSVSIGHTGHCFTWKPRIKNSRNFGYMNLLYQTAKFF